MPLPKHPPPTSAPVCTRQGEYAILCDVGIPGSSVSDFDIQRRVWAAARQISANEEVLEVVPGMNNFLVIFRQFACDFEAARHGIIRAWETASSNQQMAREVVVPVFYGGQSGGDLGFVANHAGITAEEYVRRHAAGTYVVYALGSQPGFAYLGGLDPALAVPRRDRPRPSVQAGCVMIGGSQTGIQSRTTPSGWHVVGQTTLNCFNPADTPPTLLAPGDTVRFQIQELQA